MTEQRDWLDHVRRHLDRAQWHRDKGDFEFARTELVGAITDIWTAADEIDEELATPRVVHLVTPEERSWTKCCGIWVQENGEWGQIPRVTLLPDNVTCSGEDPRKPHSGLIPPERIFR